MAVIVAGCGALKTSHDSVPPRATITQIGTIKCFAEGLTPPPGDKPPTCELSAVTKVGETLVFANDKPIPGSSYSPVFSLPFDGDRLAFGAPPHYLLTQPFLDAIKYESLTVTPDGNLVIAATGFDRHDPDKPDQDRYNTLLGWPAANPDRVSVIEASQRHGVTSSVALRPKFLAALAGKNPGTGYFKIEGLTAIPDNKLLFGIREIGASYQQPTYTIKLIEAGYTLKNGKLRLDGDFKLAYEFDPSPRLGIPHKLGLSSVEYDAARDRLYLLTSFEEGHQGETIGAYLWVLPMADMRQHKAPTPMVGPDAKPLVFSHKAEGLGILDENRIMVLFDDDRIVKKITPQEDSGARDRKLNESLFYLLDIE
jgi:hypothetical protein